MLSGEVDCFQIFDSFSEVVFYEAAMQTENGNVSNMLVESETNGGKFVPFVVYKN